MQWEIRTARCGFFGCSTVFEFMMLSAARNKMTKWRHSDGKSLLLAGFLLCMLFVASAQPPATEYQVKAAYLLDFGKFVTWPAETSPKNSEAFSICVLGDDPFGTILDNTIRGEKINGKPVTARRVHSLQQATGCHVLFVSDSGERLSRNTISALNKSGMLTVSDAHGFWENGGMIQFVFSGNRIRFEVNLDAAQEAGLTLSSELLKVAR